MLCVKHESDVNRKYKTMKYVAFCGKYGRGGAACAKNAVSFLVV
jgi:hypothetical protein